MRCIDFYFSLLIYWHHTECFIVTLSLFIIVYLKELDVIVLNLCTTICIPCVEHGYELVFLLYYCTTVRLMVPRILMFGAPGYPIA